MKDIRKKLANDEPLTRDEITNEVLDNMPQDAQEIGYKLLKTVFKDKDEILLSKFIFELNKAM